MSTIFATLFMVAGMFQRTIPPPPPAISQAIAENAVVEHIGKERNLEAKKKLILTFEKDFPKSSHLPELYMELSRTLLSQVNFPSAQQYAEKAVATVARMRSENTDPGQQKWLSSIDDSAKKNLAWVKQMVAWQDQTVRSGVLRRK